MYVAISPEIIGKELGADVRNAHNQTLLTKGSIITEAHLRTFRVWGIRSVQLLNKDAATPSPLKREHIETAMVIERKRFKHCDLAHPAMHQLFLFCVTRKALSTADEPLDE